MAIARRAATEIREEPVLGQHPYVWGVDRLRVNSLAASGVDPGGQAENNFDAQRREWCPCGKRRCSRLSREAHIDDLQIGGDLSTTDLASLLRILDHGYRR